MCSQKASSGQHVPERMVARHHSAALAHPKKYERGSISTTGAEGYAFGSNNQARDNVIYSPTEWRSGPNLADVLVSGASYQTQMIDDTMLLSVCSVDIAQKDIGPRSTIVATPEALFVISLCYTSGGLRTNKNTLDWIQHNSDMTRPVYKISCLWLLHSPKACI